MVTQPLLFWNLQSTQVLNSARGVCVVMLAKLFLPIVHLLPRSLQNQGRQILQMPPGTHIFSSMCRERCPLSKMSNLYIQTPLSKELLISFPLWEP